MLVSQYSDQKTNHADVVDLTFAQLAHWLCSPALPDTVPSYWSPLAEGEVACLVLSAHDLSRSGRETAQNRLASVLDAKSFFTPNLGDRKLLIVELQRPVVRCMWRDFSTRIADWLDIRGARPFASEKRFCAPRCKATAMARRAA